MRALDGVCRRAPLNMCHHSETCKSRITLILPTLRHKKTEIVVLESTSLCRCVYLTDVFRSGEWADSLQFDHHVNILHQWKCSIIAAKPAWAVHNGRQNQPACVVPESAAIRNRTARWRHVVVHIPRRKFHPVMWDCQSRMNEAEQVVYGTTNATHITRYIYWFSPNNTQTLKSQTTKISFN